MGIKDPPIVLEQRFNDLTCPFSASLFSVFSQVTEHTSPMEIYTSGDLILQSQLQDWASSSERAVLRSGSKVLTIRHSHNTLTYTPEKWAIQNTSLSPAIFCELLQASGSSVIQEMINLVPINKRSSQREFHAHSAQCSEDLDRLLLLMENRSIKNLIVIEKPLRLAISDYRYLQDVIKTYGLSNVLISTKNKLCHRLSDSDFFSKLNLAKVMNHRFMKNAKRAALAKAVEVLRPHFSNSIELRQYSVWMKPAVLRLLPGFCSSNSSYFRLRNIFVACLAARKLHIGIHMLKFLQIIIETKRRRRVLKFKEKLGLEIYRYYIFKKYLDRKVKRMRRKKLLQPHTRHQSLRNDAFKFWKNAVFGSNPTASVEMLLPPEFRGSEKHHLQELSSCRKVGLHVRRFDNKEGVQHDLAVLQLGQYVWLLCIEMELELLLEEGSTLKFVDPKLSILQQMPWVLFQYEFYVSSGAVRTRPLKVALLILDPIFDNRFFFFDESHLLFMCVAFGERRIKQRYIATLDIPKGALLLDGICLAHSKDHTESIYLLVVWTEGVHNYWELLEVNTNKTARGVKHLQHVKMGKASHCILRLICARMGVCHLQAVRDKDHVEHNFLFLVTDKCMCAPVPPNMIKDSNNSLRARWIESQILGPNSAVAITSAAELILVIIQNDGVFIDGIDLPTINIERKADHHAIPDIIQCDWSNVFIDRRQEKILVAVCGSRGQIVEFETFSWTVATAFSIDAKKRSNEELMQGQTMLISSKQCLILLSTLMKSILLVDLDLEILIHSKPLPGLPRDTTTIIPGLQQDTTRIINGESEQQEDAESIHRN
eukprot:Gregarina_sp_Poly_1__2267@NODE_1601_length_3738_cov_75_331790_g656_i1_p1_GENE_NODE_1601_length_3738_cov_75_331790_g656_i1NODE_1601_length_3738_cov_75_331790_g656_i1_p1_ORF_typecomplete_len825_score95_79Myosin_head/PF00063_21/3_9e05_NODE_1601_length_3738_cov_75_331790_g656_i12552729